jgi:hypothetical protein
MKTKLNFCIPTELAVFMKNYAKAHHRSMTQVLVDWLMELKGTPIHFEKGQHDTNRQTHRN